MPQILGLTVAPLPNSNDLAVQVLSAPPPMKLRGMAQRRKAEEALHRQLLWPIAALYAHRGDFHPETRPCMLQCLRSTTFRHGRKAANQDYAQV